MSQDKLLLEIDGQPLLAEFKEERGWYTGVLYPMVVWSKAGSDETGLSYCSKSSADTVDILSDDCRTLLEFSFCWRGVWEGRLYFKDEEYWAEELGLMNEAWNQLQKHLKELIRKARPGEILEG